MTSQPTIGLIECFHVPFHGGACDQISSAGVQASYKGWSLPYSPY